MAAASAPDLPEVALALDKEKPSINENNAAVQVHTPPASDQSSHGRRDDDAMSSSSLSDLDDLENDARFEDDSTGAGAGVQEEDVAGVEPDRYEGGVPIFTPVRAPTIHPI